MKAVAVTGGSSDDPEIEGTTVAGADPDDTSTRPDSGARTEPAEADGTGRAGEGPESAPESGRKPESEAGPDSDSDSESGPTFEAGAGREPESEAGREPAPGQADEDGTAGEAAGESGEPSSSRTEAAGSSGGADADADAAEADADAADEAPEETDTTRLLTMPTRPAPDDADPAAPTGPALPPPTAAPVAPSSTTADADPDPEASEEADTAHGSSSSAPIPAETTSGSPEEEAPKSSGGAPSGKDDAQEEDADATRMLRMPAERTGRAPSEAAEKADAARARTAPAPAPARGAGDAPNGTDADDDADADASAGTEAGAPTADDAADAPREEAEAGRAPRAASAGSAGAADPRDPDDAPKDSDATRLLRMPAGPTGRASSGAPEQAPEEADATRVLRAPAPAKAAGPEKPAPGARAADDAPEADSPEAAEATRVLKRPAAPAPAEPVAAEPAGEPGSRAGRPGDGPDQEGPDASGDGPRVPGWARTADADSERTSRFVALQDVDGPPPVAARTRPQPQAAPRATPQPQPLPPLDLLAELTNTPAPAQTPRRTALRRVKVWTPILLLLAGACIGGQLLRPLPDPRLVAAETEHAVDGQFSIPWPGKGQGAVRVVGSGDIGTFGEQKPVPTASVAKVMTAYVILKNHPLRKSEPGPDITVDARTVADGNSENESRITGLTAGSKFSQQDMLKMLMIPSGNNVARLLARWDTGTDSEAAFVEKMNAAARELGMKDTTYTDPSGLDAGTVSTAADQLKLAEAVMKDEAFRAIVALPEAPIKGLGEKLVNNNDLLTVQGLSIRGIKTGSSTPAGGTFVWAAYKSVGDQTPLIVGSLMEQRAPAPDENALQSLALVKANSRKIVEAVRAALASAPLIRKGDTVGYVDDGLGGRTALVAAKDLNVIGVPGQRFRLSLKAGASPLPRTAKAGTEVAVLTAGEGEGAKSVPVAVQGALAEPSFGTRLTRLG